MRWRRIERSRGSAFDAFEGKDGAFSVFQKLTEKRQDRSGGPGKWSRDHWGRRALGDGGRSVRLIQGGHRSQGILSWEAEFLAIYFLISKRMNCVFEGNQIYWNQKRCGDKAEGSKGYGKDHREREPGF